MLLSRSLAAALVLAAGMVGGAPEPGDSSGNTVVREVEPGGRRGRNDTAAAAQSWDPRPRRSWLDGDLASVPRPLITVEPIPGDDGSIRTAQKTGIGPGKAGSGPGEAGSAPEQAGSESGRPGVRISATIGDGPHAGTGDFDFYRVDLTAGATLIVHARAGAGDLDPQVVLYDAEGRARDTADNAVNDTDATLLYEPTMDGAYFVLVTAAGSWPADPTDPASGAGATTRGAYELEVSAAPADTDVYALSLSPGDVLGVASTGAPERIEIRDPGGRLVHGATGNGAGLYPAASPLPGGTVTADHVVTAAGRYTVAVTGGPGPYRLALTTSGPSQHESQPPVQHESQGGAPSQPGSRRGTPAQQKSEPGAEQTLLLTFGGADLDPALLARSGIEVPDPPGPRHFASLATLLPAWGLSAADERPLAREITAVVRERLAETLDRDGCGSRCGVRVISDLDGGLPGPDVTRIVVGGTAAATGLPTIGIGESVDPGNAARAETAVVLLDILSAAPVDDYSVNHFRTGPPARGYVAEVVGDYVLHEFGHLLGVWHTEPTGGTDSLMDVTNIARIVAGPDGTGGTPDDVRLEFAPDHHFLLGEGSTGTENTAARIAAGLAVS